MDGARLIEKLRLIEALFAGANTAWEKDAADWAKQRILERLLSIEKAAPPIEFKFTFIGGNRTRHFGGDLQGNPKPLLSMSRGNFRKRQIQYAWSKQAID